jgi:hypothetical protein
VSELPKSHPSDEKVREIAEPIFDLFYIPTHDLLGPFDEAAENLVHPFSLAAIVFRTNLDSAMRAVSIPFRMASATAGQRRFDAFLTAERIRGLKKVSQGEPLTNDIEQEALEIAKAAMDKFQQTEEATIWFRNTIIRDLAQYARDPEFISAADELLLLTLVNIWGTLEAFISESLRLLLNVEPAMASKLLSNDLTKKHFPVRAVSVDALANYNFNVAGSMGDLLLEDHHLDSLPMLKNIFNVFFPSNTQLRTSLAAPEVWTLWQRRHLIVHKRGTVDAAYLSNTNPRSG